MGVFGTGGSRAMGRRRPSDLLSIPHSGAGLFRRCVGSVAWEARKGKHFRDPQSLIFVRVREEDFDW